MIIRFSGPRGGFPAGAEQALLFRDNVQHHLQGGVPTPGYPLIHTIADAVCLAAATSASAEELWGEVSHAFRRIRHLEYRELAMSIRTRAILTNTRILPAVRGTALVRLTGWRVPMATADVTTLGDLFQSFVTRLEIFTDSGRAPWNVEIASEPARFRAPRAGAEETSLK
jgi:hypothetical protein